MVGDPSLIHRAAGWAQGCGDAAGMGAGCLWGLQRRDDLRKRNEITSPCMGWPKVVLAAEALPKLLQ